MKSTLKILSGITILLVVVVAVLQFDVNMPPPVDSSGRAAGGRGLAEPVQYTGTDMQVVVGELSVPTISPAVRDLPPYEPDFPLLDREMKPRDDHGFMGSDIQMPPHGNPLAELQQNAQPAVPDDFGTPILNFAGVQSNSSPPDDTGDVGPNHYIQGDNGPGGSRATVYDKTGTQLAQFYLEDLASGAPCNSGYCDIIVQYDEMADRWLLTEFDSSVQNLCIYVSATPDPLGTWYAYHFNPAGGMQDYPKYGVWPDGYYIGVNNNGYIHVLDRVSMLAGAPATYQSFHIGTLPGFGFQLTLPATVEGPAPPAGAPAIFMQPVDTEVHSGYNCSPEPCDLMDMWAFHVDWAVPGNSTVTALPDVNIAEFDHTLCGTGSDWSCMPQPNTTQELDPIREPIHFPLQYRNWGSYETLVGCFAEDVDGTDRAAVHWFEMRGQSGNWYMYQEGVLSESSNIHRSVCSAAMDDSGNIAVGYTRTGPDVPYYPSIYYSGRLASDPLGTMPYYDNLIWDATNSKTNNERWGDYSGIGVDPLDGCTFWYTTEYGGYGETRIAAFKFDACGSADFTLAVTPETVDICAPSDAIYDVAVTAIGGFAGDVALSADGNPGTAVFVPNPVTPDDSSVLTISGAGAGSYTFDVYGTSVLTPSLVHSDTVGLTVSETPPPAPTLLTPADGAVNVPVSPSYTWTDVGAASYDIEIATDPGFTNIVDSATGLTSPSYDGAPLVPNTVYYWHVRPHNACGAGSFSTTFSFRTVNIACEIYDSTDVPKPIPEGGGSSGTTTSVLDVAAGGSLVDVNVLNLAGTHTYMGDLDFYLDSPATTQVQLMEQACGTAENFDLNLDDEAAPGPWPCPPIGGGTYQPTEPLAGFDGENSTGTWTLTIVDNYTGDTGQLNSWSLELCTEVPQCVSPTIQLLSDSPVELGHAMHFTAELLYGTAPTTYTWDFGGPGYGADLDTATPVYTYTDYGSYTVVVTAENECGDDTDSAQVEVVCYEPQVGVSSDSPVELGEAMHFTADVLSGTMPLSYTWGFGGEGYGTGQDTATPVFTYTAPGNYTATVTVTNACGSAQADTAAEVVCHDPEATFSHDSPVELGRPIHFAAAVTGTGTISYTWDFGDGVGSSAEANPVYTYTTAGDFVVTLTVEDLCGSRVVTDTVTVNALWHYIYLPIVQKQ